MSFNFWALEVSEHLQILGFSVLPRFFKINFLVQLERKKRSREGDTFTLTYLLNRKAKPGEIQRANPESIDKIVGKVSYYIAFVVTNTAL